MRWSEYTAALSLAKHERLVNHITAGCGYMAVVGRLVRADGELVRVVERLTAAQLALVGARSLIILEPATADGCGVMLPRNQPVPRLSWQSFLAQQPPAYSGLMLASLQEAVRCARAVGQGVLADGEVGDMRDCLDGAVVALARVRSLIAGSA